ncbi:hypothetical protein [Ilumatobacter sp.]|uniref:hypothetical protein n=1 Tax=Ilumatobacter sp. TaxID=1967498 RepID=UPI003C66D06B
MLIAAVLSACAGSSDSATPATTGSTTASTIEAGDGVAEIRSEIGPRAFGGDDAMMVLDSIDVSGDDIFVRLRVVNGSDRFLNVGVQDTWYGPLLEMRDSLGNTYPARAVEPDGVEAYSVGDLRLRLAGPLDPEAEEFALELATDRGTLVTDAIPVPTGDGVRWWVESPPMDFADPAVGGRGGRTVEVLDVVDRGSHLDVSFRAVDDSTEFDLPHDAIATLTLADGTEIPSIPFEHVATENSGMFSGVLRFLGTTTGSDALSLNVAGVDVEIPPDCGDEDCRPLSSASATEPPLAVGAVLPELLHQIRTTEPLPPSSVDSGPVEDS